MDCGDTKLENFDAEMKDRTRTLLRSNDMISSKDTGAAEMRAFLDTFDNQIEEYRVLKQSFKAPA